MSVGSHESRIARGALAQQGAQIVAVVAMLGAVTVLGRHLTLREFGVYGLVLSIASYLLIVQLSVEGAVVRAIARGQGAERDRVFSTALVLYGVAGALSGVLVAAAGLVVIAAVGIPPALRGSSREAMIALGVATALGWPFKVFQDVLRGTQRFIAASFAEILANGVYVASIVAVALTDGPFWLLIALGGSLSILIGLASAVVCLVVRAPFAFRRGDVHRETAGQLLRVGGGLGALGLTDLLVYSLDRVILAAFRPTAVVGLYEAVTRPHALVRQLNSTLVITAMPVAAGYVAVGDEARLQELVVRGTRYVLAVVVPVVVLLVVMSGPVLEVWLGPRFLPAATAMALFVGYWLVAANMGPATSGLIAVGRVRELAVYAWVGSLFNLGASLALTPWLGLEGPIVATCVQVALQFPWFLHLTLSHLPVRVGQLARQAWLPAYTTGALVAVLLVLARTAFDMASLPALVAAAAATAVVAVACWWFLWFDAAERRLIGALLGRTATRLPD